jgi:two-component system response regulator
METGIVDLLLVEDSQQDIELTLHALRSRNLANRVTVARDGEEALQLIADCERNYKGTGRGMPRLILLDLKLPKVDGLEVLRKLKAHPETSSIPIVVLSSSREDSDIQAAYVLGVNSYIVKPIDFAKFTDAVTQLGLYWLLLNEAPALT